MNNIQQPFLTSIRSTVLLDRGTGKDIVVFQVLSGQYLHGDEDSQLPIRVDVETVGVPEDCAPLSTEVCKLSVPPF